MMGTMQTLAMVISEELLRLWGRKRRRDFTMCRGFRSIIRVQLTEWPRLVLPSWQCWDLLAGSVAAGKGLFAHCCQHWCSLVLGSLEYFSTVTGPTELQNVGREKS